MKLVNYEDDYTRELESDKKKALWRARLSNGEIIVQDDFRQGLDIPSAWVRLALYLKENNLNIEKFWLEFRSNKLFDILPEKAEGYFFCKSILGFLQNSDILNFYIVGYLDKDIIRTFKYSIPELILIESEDRQILEREKECLIRNVIGKTEN